MPTESMPDQTTQTQGFVVLNIVSTCDPNQKNSGTILTCALEIAKTATIEAAETTEIAFIPLLAVYLCFYQVQIDFRAD